MPDVPTGGRPSTCIMCNRPRSLNGPGSRRLLCLDCWEREKVLADEAIDRAGDWLKELGT